MMWFWLYGRQNRFPQITGEEPYVNFTCKLLINLERNSSTAFGTLITDQTIVQETLSNSEYADKLRNFMRQSNFELIAISIDGRELFRHDYDTDVQDPIAGKYLVEGFTAIADKIGTATSVDVIARAKVDSFHIALTVSFASRHPAGRYSLECLVNAVPQVYFKAKMESLDIARARINQFNQLMFNRFERSAFVIQERDLMIPILENLVARISSNYTVKNGRIQLYEGRGSIPIWRRVIDPKAT